ncbi:uncharacterized protein LOC123872478 isoform X2 [Maniola jurtina]|uniref:uncharacterized protein LOC123872478 isoform X2 n=1 Tax=Maniola jurtina TaxID=191418 RepID=UPI001E68FD05|nr:uncharacterized protein LOC123872478 isoform X2 [Maniola jurtina]
MSVELLRILKNEAKYASEDKKSGRWLKRKETIRAQRVTLYRNSLRKERTKRQIENATETSTIEAGPRKSASPPSRVSAGEIEWSGVTGGPPAEVVLRLHPSTSTYPGHNPRTNYSTSYIDGSGVVVRAEEALIVAFVLLLWVAAIALFFNRWGKIRCVYKLMLEPYQPKFQQQHRQSCALAEASVSVPPHHRASLSRGCVSYDCGVSFSAYQPCGYLAHRPRQNSVFVGSMGGMALIPESPPRRSRSVADLPALVTPSDHATHTPRSSRAASLHSAVDLRVCASPRTSRAASLHSTADMQHVQVHVRGSVANVNKPRSPRRLTITNV